MRYREQICSFNDDIQGTASVVLAGLFSAIKLQKSTLKEQRIAVFGGGSAGMGICKLILHALMKEGMTEQEARLHFYIIDIDGLIHTDLVHLDEEQRKFATPTQEIASWMVKDRQRISLLEVIHHVHPSILIGVSAQPGAFNEEVVMAMSAYVERPIIFPLSNPTTKSEARPQDLIQWTKGKALIATGSPFAPVQYFAKTHTISQCNNVYSFPGIGLGVVTAKIPKVTESMFIRAAHILSDHSPLLNEIQGPIFPGFENLRAISRAIAIGVIQQAEQEGLCSPTSLSAIEKRVDQKMWTPHYACYTQKAASKALS
jgi:malate dehydrogenase (oxaloacetate-decarboxylating)